MILITDLPLLTLFAIMHFKDTGKVYTKITLKKNMNMDIWVVNTLQQLFIVGSYKEIKFSKKTIS